MVTMVQRSLDDTGTDASRLMVEITETAVMGDRVRAIDHLDQLHALGVRVAVDDFGTGYTSIDDLKRIPVDLLKIDRSFTAASATPSGWAMLQALSALATAVGVLTVAEGVETVEQLEAVRLAGCHWAQGYLLGRPVPVEQVSHDVVDVARPA
jgi:EAL domain-containing protein (putative c-di-GMP-specific phosphodiesterase class I)